MQLTEQQRAELERRRFRPVPISDDGVVIVDYVGQRQWYIGPGDGELAYRRAMELAAVLGITPPGYRLVPEAMVEALTIMADGCPTHPGYRAKRPATATYCERCRQVWEARQTISRLQQDGSPGQHGVGCSITLTDQERQIVCAALQAFAEHAEWQAGQERPDVQGWRVAAATARAVRARFQQNGGEGR